MGQMFSIANLTGRKEIQIYMHGFSGAGKQSILKKLELQTESPKNGRMPSRNNMKKVTINNITVMSWDVGGRCYDRATARHYYRKGVDAILVVVDSSTDLVFAVCRVILDMLLTEEHLKDAILLVLANKQDLPGASSAEEISTNLNFGKLTKSHVTNIFGCSAETGEGLQEAMDWLAGELEKKKEKEEETTETEKEAKKSRSLISKLKNGFHVLKAMLPKAA